MYFGAITATTIGVLGSVAGGLIGSQGSKSAAGAQGAAYEAANKERLAIAQEAYNQRLRAVEEANRLAQDAYKVARPEITSGYDTSSNILGETYGTPAREAVAASGTSPEQLTQMQQARNAVLGQYQQAGTKAEQIMTQLKSMTYGGGNAQQIAQLQNQYNDALRQQQALKPQLDQAEQALSTAKPYTPGQEAQAATVGRAPQALLTAADQTKDYLNTGYDAAGNYINAGYDAAGNFVNLGYDQAGNAINTATGDAIDIQRPFYDTGVRALAKSEEMLQPGYQFGPQDPGYQFRLEQENKAINNSAAAKGNLLSGATLKALASYTSGLASQEFQNAFSRWNTLAGQGQQAGNVISNLEQNRGNTLSGLEVGRGTDLANLSTGRAGLLASNSTDRGVNLGNVSSNLGNNLSSLYTKYGDTMANNSINQGNALSNLTLNQGQYLANNALGNADFFNNTVGGAGADIANRTADAGDARAAGIAGSANAINQGIGGASNALLQGLTLYGGQRQSGYDRNGDYFNRRYMP